ncbi:MAG: DUF4446 family protein [Bacillota bacterium]|nr:DUF4446 family protein [Bacillota bacterium]MDW7684283.1 DUF4446 family protein [Bacillota bacterium]
MEPIVYSLTGMILILLIFCLVLYRKTVFLTRRYQDFMQGNNGVSLEAFLHRIHDEIGEVNQEVQENRQRMQDIIAVLDTTVRGIGVVRFNAFQDTGSDLSFAVACLDAHKNGVVISSIYGREESRTYAKPLTQGQSTYQLSTEEQEAISRAAGSVLSVRKPGTPGV